MLVLLDECLPRPLKRELPEFNVQTVPEMGWSGLKNGELLRRIRQAGVDFFVTGDQNLQYQQSLRASGVSVIVLCAATNRLADLLPLMRELKVVLSSPPTEGYIELHARKLNGLGTDN
jgi:hypothetical protein